MLTALRRCVHLFSASKRSRWFILVALAVVVGIFEAAGAVLVYSLLALVSSSEGPTLPLVGDLSVRLSDGADTGLVVVVMGLIGVFFLVRGILFLAQTYVRSRAAHNAGATLATRLLIGYLEMPYAFHLQRNSSELIRNSQYSVLDLVVHAFIPTVTIASEALLVGGILIALLVAAPSVTLLMAFVVGPIVFLLMRIVQPRLQALGQVNQDMVGANVKILQQGFEGVRDIKLSGTARFFRSHFEASRLRLAASLYKKETIQDVPRVAVETLVFLLLLVFAGYSTVTRSGVEEAIPVLGLFVYAIFRILPSLNRILASVNVLRFGFAAIDHVYDDLMTIEKSAPSPPSTAAIRLADRIDVVKVTFTYAESDRPVLNDIDLTISRGESVGVVGTTGSGKSTLIDVLVGLLEPDSGTVLVDGVDIRTNPRAWQDQIGMVSQSVFLLDDSLRNNVAFGIPTEAIDETALEDAIRMAQLEDFVASLPQGLETVVGERGVRMSGGQRQRLAIARAIYRRPALLVLDEGTSALDNQTESQFMTALNSLRGERTLILVAHRLSTVRTCDRIVLMRSGAILDVGTYEELLERNLYFRNLAS